MDRGDRLARNLAIAEKYYDGYHGSVARGRLDKVFDPDDFADEWIFCSPYLGGETVQGRSTFLAEGAVANHDTIWQRIPDYKMDYLKAWPTEAGCAWRWCVNGHGLDGRYVEFWEQLFIWTNEDGKITRFEFFDDWHGFAQALTYAYGITLDEFTRIERYGSAPWNPGPSMSIQAPAGPPRAEPPVSPETADKLALAQRYFQRYQSIVGGSQLDGLAAENDFADDWVLFSPWFGEQRWSSADEFGALAAIERDKARQRLPDYKVDHFEAWPNDEGCAWRCRVGGHGIDGTYYEFWQQVFMVTNSDGRIARLEFYGDWQGFPQTLGYVTGLSIDQLWEAENYNRWVTS